MSGRRFVLLDRDGTVIVERHYLADPDGVTLLPGAVEGLLRLRRLDLRLAIVSNQSGIGRGYFSDADLKRVNARMTALLAAEGIHLDGIYCCPHAPEQDCDCRKPKPGLVEAAARELDFDPRAAFVVGDSRADVDLGRAVGATSVLVRTGHGEDTLAQAGVSPDHVVANLAELAGTVEELLGCQAQ